MPQFTDVAPGSFVFKGVNTAVLLLVLFSFTLLLSVRVWRVGLTFVLPSHVCVVDQPGVPVLGVLPKVPTSAPSVIFATEIKHVVTKIKTTTNDMQDLIVDRILFLVNFFITNIIQQI